MTRDELIRRIHDATPRMVLAASGGGSTAIAELLSAAGASRTVIEAVIPYSAKAMDLWLGAAAEHYCDSRTARAMAMAAFQLALRCRERENEPLAGVACTAALATDRPKRGPHRIHAAMQTESMTLEAHVELTKAARDRAAEERIASDMVLNLAAQACGLDDRIRMELLEGERIETTRTEAPADWSDLLAGRVDAVCRAATPEEFAPSSGLIFSGAFNPRHEGHRRMAEVAAQLIGRPVEHELSLLSVDKLPLDFTELMRRAEQFDDDEPLWLTRATTFSEKCDVFPGATFILGVDTLRRIADPRYYPGGGEHRDAAIAHLAQRGCRLLVFGRTIGGAFATLSDLQLPDQLRMLCEEVPESRFHEDISSTQLRRR